MTSTTVLIAEDEPLAAEALADWVRATPGLQLVAVCEDGEDALAQIRALRPALVLTDIQMPGLTGLQVVQALQGDAHSPRIIFTTAYDQHALTAFELHAVDYLLKPLKTERLLACVARLREGPAGRDDALAETLKRLLPGVAAGTGAPRLRYIRAAQGELMHQIPVDEVLFFHADDKYTGVQTATLEHLIRTPIVELVGQLDPERFWQVHRSTIINLDHLAGTRRDEQSRLFVRLRGQARELPVSRAYVHLFKAM